MNQISIPDDIIYEILSILASEGDINTISKFHSLSSSCCTQVRKHVFAKIDAMTGTGTSCNRHNLSEIIAFFSEHTIPASYIRSFTFYLSVLATSWQQESLYNMVLHNLPNLVNLTVSFTPEFVLPTITPRSFRAALQQLPPSASLQELHLKGATGLAIAEIAGIKCLKRLRLSQFSLNEEDDEAPFQQTQRDGLFCQLAALHLYKPIRTTQLPGSLVSPAKALLARLDRRPGGRFILPLSQLRVFGIQTDTTVMFEDMLELIREQRMFYLEDLTIELGNLLHFPSTDSHKWLQETLNHLPRALKRLVLRPVISEKRSFYALFGSFRDTITLSADLLKPNVIEELELHIVVEHLAVSNFKRVGRTMGEELFRLVQAFNLVSSEGIKADGWRCLKRVRLLLGLRGTSTFSTVAYLKKLKSSVTPHLEPLFGQFYDFGFEIVYSGYDDL